MEAGGEQPGEEGADGQDPDDAGTPARHRQYGQAEWQGAEIEGSLPAIPGSPEGVASAQELWKKELRRGPGKEGETRGLDVGDGDSAKGVGDQSIERSYLQRGKAGTDQGHCDAAAEEPEDATAKARQAGPPAPGGEREGNV